MRILAQMIVCSQRSSSGGTAQTSTKGMYPGGESKSVRDAYDAQQKGGKK